MRIIRLLAATAFLTAPLQTQAAAPTAAKNDDPSREICKSKGVIGSRLKRVRECHSVAEWEELELQEQLGLRRRQVNGDAGCNFEPGNPVCGVRAGGRDTPW
jgi:hypothetical protein